MLIEYTGTGNITVLNGDTLKTIDINCSHNPSKILKFCGGFDHLVLLKEHGETQRISENDIFDHSLSFLSGKNIVDIAFGHSHSIALTGIHSQS